VATTRHLKPGTIVPARGYDPWVLFECRFDRRCPTPLSWEQALDDRVTGAP